MKICHLNIFCTFSEVMVSMHCKAVVSTFVNSFLGKGGSKFFRSHTHSFPLSDYGDQMTGEIHYKRIKTLSNNTITLQY